MNAILNQFDALLVKKKLRVLSDYEVHEVDLKIAIILADGHDALCRRAIEQCVKTHGCTTREPLASVDESNFGLISIYP